MAEAKYVPGVGYVPLADPRPAYSGFKPPRGCVFHAPGFAYETEADRVDDMVDALRGGAR